MSVLLATSLGDIVIDLHTDRCPLTTKNFLKLCKIKYFNGCLFHTIQKDFTAQTGDPTGQGTGGDSIYKFLYGEQARFFGDEIQQDLKHSKAGTVAMASAGENLNASQFYFTLRDDLDYLDGKHTVFGEVAEGLETLTRINEAYVDEKNRPYKNIRIKHTYILDDPFDDPPQLAELIPDASPEGKPHAEVDDDVRLEDDWVPMDEQLGTTELEEVLRAKEAHSRAVVLESIGDIPDAEVKPPENVLFVCKLNPVTEDEDLNTIFSRFGTVVSADVIRDYKTGDSLCYAFIEFETNEACEQAYFKMDNALIDDRRIHVDFSQSVAKLWSQYRRKEHQTGKGRGCFKCGALDHIAKDCTGDGDTKPQTQKYILKDENSQHGGTHKSTYKMVFDGDSPENSDRDKRHREQVSENEMKRRRIGRQSEEDVKERDREQRDCRSEKSRHSDRNSGSREDERSRRGHNEDTTRDGEKRDYRTSKKYNDTSRVPREDERNHGSRGNGSRRGADSSERVGRDEGHHKKHGSYEDRTSERERGGKNKSERDNRNNDVEGSRRDEQDLMHGDREGARSEKDYRKTDSQGGKRSDRDYRKDGSEGGNRNGENYRKTESGRGKGDENDYRKSDSAGGMIEKAYRKNEGEGGKRSERDHRKTDREGGRSELK